jgi:hypothetical protein
MRRLIDLFCIRRRRNFSLSASTKKKLTGFCSCGNIQERKGKGNEKGTWKSKVGGYRHYLVGPHTSMSACLIGSCMSRIRSVTISASASASAPASTSTSTSTLAWALAARPSSLSFLITTCCCCCCCIPQRPIQPVDGLFGRYWEWCAVFLASAFDCIQHQRMHSLLIRRHCFKHICSRAKQLCRCLRLCLYLECKRPCGYQRGLIGESGKRRRRT